MMRLYRLPFMAILIHYLSCLIASTGLLRFVPKKVGKMFNEADFWLRSGRTVFSIPFALLMLLPLYFQILFIEFDFEAIERARGYMTSLGWSDVGQLWKDPLEDRLYII
jgi:hypothetical protein